MEFNNWMKGERLSAASISKYRIAIKGVLSDWARDADIIEGSLLDISDPSEFSKVVLEIKKLPIFKSRDSVGNQMYAAALKKYAQYLYYFSQPNIESDIADILENENIKPTDKARLVNARIGQGKYRKDLIGLWGCCCVTGYSDISILMASHIKPWSQSSNIERLDKYNGLLLLPNLDKAFDRGLISFDDCGKIMISSHIEGADILGIHTDMLVALGSKHQKYISFHRTNIFKK